MFLNFVSFNDFFCFDMFSGFWVFANQRDLVSPLCRIFFYSDEFSILITKLAV